jgi:hypothetical protein
MLMPGNFHTTTIPWSEAQTFLRFFRVSRHAGALQHERQRTEDDRWTGLVDENHMLRSRELYLLVCRENSCAGFIPPVTVSASPTLRDVNPGSVLTSQDRHKVRAPEHARFHKSLESKAKASPQ